VRSKLATYPVKQEGNLIKVRVDDGKKTEIGYDGGGTDGHVYYMRICESRTRVVT
jgi:hypothetical protein